MSKYINNNSKLLIVLLSFFYMRYYSTLFLFFIITVFVSFNVLSADCKKPVMPSNDEWQNWLSEIKKEALKEGISQNTIEAELSDVTPQKKIIMRDRCQPESTITLKEYLYYRVDKSRIIAGRNMMKKYKGELNQISNHFGIQPRFIIAISWVWHSPGDVHQHNVRLSRYHRSCSTHSSCCTVRAP